MGEMYPRAAYATALLDAHPTSRAPIVVAKTEMTTLEVDAKRKAAEEWCRHASTHAATHGGKPWRYALVPHDIVADNMTLERLTGDLRL